MMEARELRIGNLIQHFDKRFDREPIEVFHLDWDVEDRCRINYTYSCLYSGIEINEEWFNKFGIELFDYDKYFIIGNRRFDQGEFKYVHQLQNLYFALTGKELELKQTEK